MKKNDAKKTIAKLTLNRETLRSLMSLEPDKLQEVNGGIQSQGGPVSCGCWH
jgi:hypothetical protein